MNPCYNVNFFSASESWSMTLQAIQEQMTMHGQEPVSFEDVKDEIFDMVKPADPCKITLQDLLSW